MTNDVRISRHKKTAIYLGIIIPILAIVVSIIIWLLGLEHDYNISVDPMDGVVQQDGVIQTTITVKGIHGYEYNVSLSASGQPSDVVVTFAPPMGGPKPAFTSNVMVDVGSDVPIGSYEIIIKGIGADGKEHSCTYILSVIQKPVTPSETTEEEEEEIQEEEEALPEEEPEDKPVPFPEIEIISPEEGDEVPISIIVSGSFSGELPEGQYMWVVINPHPSPGQWWPQGGRIDPREEWEIPIWLGREKQNIGDKFDIAVILVNEEDNQDYVDYLKTGEETGSYPGILLPDSADIVDRITVIRK